MNREKGDAISLDFPKILTEGSCGLGDMGGSRYRWEIRPASVSEKVVCENVAGKVGGKR